MNQRLCGRVMLDLTATELDQEETELIQHPAVGGIILFTRNYESPAQLHSLVTAIRSTNPDILIAVDQEGGRVQRFREGFSWLPPLNWFGKIFELNQQDGIQCANTFAQLMASEILEYGIDFSFSPVLDVDYNRNTIVGDRSFHSDINSLVTLASHYIKGMHQAGMAVVGKHFPGHGYVTTDSHNELPVDSRNYEQLFSSDLFPFRQLCTELDAIMPAHILYENIDKHPAGYSSYWLKTVLQETLHFNGVIFSDDLNMEGASASKESYLNRAECALDAGCKMVLICNNRPAAIEIITGLAVENARLPYQEIAAMRQNNKYKTGLIDKITLQHKAQNYRDTYDTL